MKEKHLQSRLLYPARISFKYEGEINIFTDKQKLREFSTIKPIFQQMLSIFSSQETQKRFVNLNPNNKVNSNGIILINSFFKRKWVECSNQKTKIGWMDTKIRPLYILSIRDPPQNKGHIQTESEGLEKVILCKWRLKESRSTKSEK